MSRRGCDFSGNWTTATYTGGDGYCAVLGMTEEQKAKHVSAILQPMAVSRQPNGVVQIKSSSPYIPGGLLNVKSGEPWSYDLPGVGTVEASKPGELCREVN